MLYYLPCTGDNVSKSAHYSVPITDRLQLLEFIRWCRQTLGERGVRWDFSGGQKVSVWFMDSEAELMYVMKYQWAQSLG